MTNVESSELNDWLDGDINNIEKCPKCAEDLERKYYPQEIDTFTQLWCKKCNRGYGAVELA